MDMLWNQFKLFQRSLQSKSENDPVDGLMMLIGKNYDDLIAEGDKLMEMRNTEKRYLSLWDFMHNFVFLISDFLYLYIVNVTICPVQ